MLTRKKQLTIADIVKITGQGETIEFPVVFNNVSQQQLEEVTNKADMKPYEPTLLIVNSWDAEYPLTPEGVLEAEGDRPGLLVAILQQFYSCRQVFLQGN